MKMTQEGKKTLRSSRKKLGSSLAVSSLIGFTCTYMSCLMTPIVFGIEQDVHWNSGMMVFLMLCDVWFAFDFYVWYKQNRSYLLKRKLQKIPNSIIYDGMLRFVGFSTLYLVPLASVCGVNGRDQAWLTIFRMVSVFSFVCDLNLP